VWTTNTNRKIVSIGMRSSRSVTSHGFALNVDGDLTPWTLAVPCGMPDVEMTSILRELGHASMEETRRVVAEVFEAS